jgi:hypothetical protein
MKTGRLTIAGIQIYFDDAGAALFDARGKQRAVVELELAEYRDFIDRWLDASEEPRPREVGPDEQRLRANLKLIIRAFRRQFDRACIDTIMRTAAKQPSYSALSSEQIEESIAEAISTL